MANMKLKCHILLYTYGNYIDVFVSLNVWKRIGGNQKDSKTSEIIAF